MNTSQADAVLSADELEARARFHLGIGYPTFADEVEYDDREGEDDDYDGWSGSRTCRHCSGTGGDPWNDYILPCEHCDGEGYEWWN